VREILVTSNAVSSALASYEAASELRRAASVTYDAAFEAYQNGLGTLTDVTTAESGLLDARQAQADAHAAALIAASTLAFTLGNMTSSAAPSEALR
jgi:outer membrane protein TolC